MAPPEADARRIAAVVLPDLVVELASATLGVERALAPPLRTDPKRRGKKPRAIPLGVVVTRDGARNDTEPVKATALLDAVNGEARRFGVCEGQSIAEATALVAHLALREVAESELGRALGTLAETALAFGATVAIEAPDTVWVDVTGAAHLFGGEEALAAELASRVRSLGHLARVAVASGPRVAQALARWASPAVDERHGERGVLVVPAAHTEEALSGLPVAALPLDRERVAWLFRLGLFSLADLAKLPRAAAASRLGDQASRLLDFVAGKDDTPLVAYQPPTLVSEATSWEEPASGIEPLRFVLRGLTSKISARLAGRGEAAQKLVLVIEHDRSIARHRGVSAETELVFDLASPLWREEEIHRVVVSRLARTRLGAPSIALRLEAPAVIRALPRQLDLSRVSAGITGKKGLESLPVLLAELAADIGKSELGVLQLVDTHRPEQKSELCPALGDPRARPPKKAKARGFPLYELRPVTSHPPGAPTRFLPKPMAIDAALRVGATFRIDHRLYTIERMSFVERLESVEWWSAAPVARDYLRLWLSGQEGGLEALVYVDRDTGRRFLHALAD
jgi:protein ImuB